MSHVIRHTSHVTRHTSHAPRHTSHVTRHTSHVTRHTSHVTRRTSHVTRHTSHVTRHTSHVTRHTPHVTRHTSLAGWQHHLRCIWAAARRCRIPQSVLCRTCSGCVMRGMRLGEGGGGGGREASELMGSVLCSVAGRQFLHRLLNLATHETRSIMLNVTRGVPS
jgi:hypothetical protein